MRMKVGLLLLKYSYQLSFPSRKHKAKVTSYFSCLTRKRQVVRVFLFQIARWNFHRIDISLHSAGFFFFFYYHAHSSIFYCCLPRRWVDRHSSVLVGYWAITRLLGRWPDWQVVVSNTISNNTNIQQRKTKSKWVDLKFVILSIIWSTCHKPILYMFS